MEKEEEPCIQCFGETFPGEKNYKAEKSWRGEGQERTPRPVSPGEDDVRLERQQNSHCRPMSCEGRSPIFILDQWECGEGLSIYVFTFSSTHVFMHLKLFPLIHV